MMEKHQGGCVCGGVRFVAEGDPQRVTMCHCTWCQRRTGSAFGTEAVYPLDRVTLRGDALRVHRHRSDLSGRWLDQHFCGTCGSNLGLTLEVAPDIRSLPAGAFDDPAFLMRSGVPFRHIFLRSSQGWAEVPTGMECHEMHFRPGG